jgi:hypothetical protein
MRTALRPRLGPTVLAITSITSIAAPGCSHSSSNGDTNQDNASQPAGSAPAPAGPTAAGQGNGDDGEPAPVPVPFVPFDINHVISTGQSNSVAHGAKPPLTTSQPYQNLMFDVGVMTVGTCEQEGCRDYQKPSSFVPLMEGDSFWYPVETMSSGLGNMSAKLAMTKYGQASHVVLVSLAGRNGLTYWCLRKGSCNYVDPAYIIAYDESMMQVRDAKAIADAQHKSYVVRMATTIHGESDDYGYALNHQEFPLDGTDGSFQSVKDYADGLMEWQHDYETGVQAITGQTQSVPLLISQHSNWAWETETNVSAVAQYQYEAHVRSKGKVVLVTPGYPLSYASDCRHYDSNSERRLGEYFGKAYARIILQGLPWDPVRPKKITHQGNVVTAKFTVPVPPLVFDTDLVVNPGNYGFDAVDANGAAIPVTAVALGGPDSVLVTLASEPGAGARLRYAFTSVPHTCAGSQLGARGNLHDSDTTQGNYGYLLYNWGVHFSEVIE